MKSTRRASLDELHPFFYSCKMNLNLQFDKAHNNAYSAKSPLFADLRGSAEIQHVLAVTNKFPQKTAPRLIFGNPSLRRRMP